MFVRRAFFAWLLPAAFLLPLWLFVGWVAFDGGAGALAWIFFLAVPSVFVGQLVLSLLTYLRPSVRTERAVSWWDVAGFGAWHALTIALGFFGASWWTPVFVLAMLGAVGMLWLQIWQLVREARDARASLVLSHTAGGMGYIPPERESGRRPHESSHEVFVISEDERR